MPPKSHSQTRFFHACAAQSGNGWTDVNQILHIDSLGGHSDIPHPNWSKGLGRGSTRVNFRPLAWNWHAIGFYAHTNDLLLKTWLSNSFLLNYFACVLLDQLYLQNICRMLCTCILANVCGYSYDKTAHCGVRSIPGIEDMNTGSLQCIHEGGYSCAETMCCDVKNIPHIEDMNTVSVQSIHEGGYSYDKKVCCDVKNVSRIEDMNTVSLQCLYEGGYSCA